jgi:hypothetical protein
MPAMDLILIALKTVIKLVNFHRPVRILCKWPSALRLEAQLLPAPWRPARLCQSRCSQTLLCKIVLSNLASLRLQKVVAVYERTELTY